MIKLGTKVYRNIQEQVAKNTDDIAKLWRRPIFQIKVVEELPEEGEASTLYLLPASDPETGNYFEEYLWIDSAWELIGSSAVDISNMVTTDTDQTITSVKTFDSEIHLNDSIKFSPTSTYYGKITAESQGIKIGTNVQDMVAFSGYGFYARTDFQPSADNSYDLGQSSNKWKNLYLYGNISDGANSASVADIAALITYAKAQGWIS